MESIRNLYILWSGGLRILAFLSDEEAELAADLFDLTIVGVIWDANRIQNYREELRRDAGIPS